MWNSQTNKIDYLGTLPDNLVEICSVFTAVQYSGERYLNCTKVMSYFSVLDTVTSLICMQTQWNWTKLSSGILLRRPVK